MLILSQASVAQEISANNLEMLSSQIQISQPQFNIIFSKSTSYSQDQLSNLSKMPEEKRNFIRDEPQIAVSLLDLLEKYYALAYLLSWKGGARRIHIDHNIFRNGFFN